MDKGAYYHICFVRGKRSLARQKVRQKYKGTRGRRAPTNQWDEPDFYLPEWENHFEASLPPALLQHNIASLPQEVIGYDGACLATVEHLAWNPLMRLPREIAFRASPSVAPSPIEPRKKSWKNEDFTTSELEPIPLPDAHQNGKSPENSSTHLPPYFKLVDPDHNIYSL